jgi:hypothetical protein
MRMRKSKQYFYDFYQYSHLDEIDKKKNVDENAWFILVKEIHKFIRFFKTYVNTFRHLEKDTSYKKQYSCVCSEKIIFIINTGILDFLKYWRGG